LLSFMQILKNQPTGDRLAKRFEHVVMMTNEPQPVGIQAGARRKKYRRLPRASAHA
jgi:hypothetical protein